jgi:hypothetical protein
MTDTAATAHDTAPKWHYREHHQILAIVPPTVPLRAVYAIDYDDHVEVEAYDVLALALVQTYTARAEAGEYLGFDPDSGRWRSNSTPGVQGVHIEHEAFTGGYELGLTCDTFANSSFLGYAHDGEALEPLVEHWLEAQHLPVVVVDGELKAEVHRRRARVKCVTGGQARDLLGLPRLADELPESTA